MRPRVAGRERNVQERRILRVVEAIAAQPPGALPERLCGAAADLLDASGASVSVAANDDLLQVVCATDGVARTGEDLQVDLGEGPSYSAHRNGYPVLVADINLDESWPAFAPAAADSGLRGIFAFPLRRGAVRVGALTLYREVPGYLTDDQHHNALVFAQVALDLVLALQANRPADELDDVFLAEFGNHAAIHQASGIVSVQLGVAVGAALGLLRAHSYANDRSLLDIAADVVARRLRFDHDD
jgi:GAF domain-containing protein